MTTRSRDKTLTFSKPFLLRGVDRRLPAGAYRVTTDEELVEGLSFPVYRRIATMIFVPRGAAMEMVTIDPADLKAAQERDAERDADAGERQHDRHAAAVSLRRPVC